MKSVFFSLVCCFLVGETFLCADDIDVLQSRLREEYVNTTSYSSAGSYLSSQQRGCEGRCVPGTGLLVQPKPAEQ